MLHALGAATSALDLLKSLTASKSQSAGNKQEPKSPFDLSGSSTTSESSPSRSGLPEPSRQSLSGLCEPRNVRGVAPVHRLKARLKALTSEYPSRNATSVSVCLRSFK